MGNNDVNALPRCQMLRLQSMVDQATEETHKDYTPENSGSESSSSSDSESSSSSSSKSSDSWETIGSSAKEETSDSESSPRAARRCGFWIDTLCIPVNKELKAYRSDAIAMMAKIYGSAERVLVLDAFVQEVSRTAPEIDRVTHLYLSSWHRRLWTLQEGLLAKKLSFQFSDGSQTMRDMHSDDDEKDTSPRTFYSSVRGSCGGEFDPF